MYWSCSVLGMDNDTEGCIRDPNGQEWGLGREVRDVLQVVQFRKLRGMQPCSRSGQAGFEEMFDMTVDRHFVVTMCNVIDEEKLSSFV